MGEGRGNEGRESGKKGEEERTAYHISDYA
jgi:hypothetical protein